MSIIKILLSLILVAICAVMVVKMAAFKVDQNSTKKPLRKKRVNNKIIWLKEWLSVWV